MPTVNAGKIKELLFPLPPLAEQARIVAKLDALLAETDALKAQETALADAQKNFPKMLRASLLQAAIEGKLTERESGDGHAQELLQQIQAEKAALIKAGRLKKSKGLPEISEDEKPFTIPENWVWVRLGEIGYIQTGNTPSKAQKDNYGADFPFFKPADLSQGKNITEASEFLSLAGKSKARVVEKDSLLINGIGNVGRLGIVRVDGAFNQQMHSFTPYGNCVLLELSYLFLQSPHLQQMMRFDTAQTTIPILNKNNFSMICFPLPPLAEQARIVAKLDALLAQIESLENLS